MVAITMVLAGVITLWVFSFTEDDDDKGDIFIFDVSLDGGADTIVFSLIDGVILDSNRIGMNIDGYDVQIPTQEFKAGEEVTLISPIPLNPGQYYQVKIVIDTRLSYNRDLIASN
ncbi:MAG: hypothetical protein ACMUIE_01115 [Thermoplasmatota archaeon]